MKLVGYVRVSSDGQEDNTSLPEQRRRLESYCVTYGHELVAVFEDVASGKNIKRTGLQDALAALEEADGLVVLKLDRLSRNLRDTLALVEDVFMAGDKNLVSVSEHIDTHTPAGRMFLSMVSSFAAYERDLIRERTQSGKRAKLAAGGYAHGAPRLGYRADNRELVKDEAEQATISTIKRHRRAGKSYNAIAAWLNDNGVKSKRGGKWTAQSVINVLKAEKGA